MAQYNSVNVKLSNSQLNKLKSATKNETGITLRVSATIIDNSDNEINFPHALLLTYGQIRSLCKAFANSLSASIKFSKTKLSKVIQLGGFLVDFLNYY